MPAPYLSHLGVRVSPQVPLAGATREGILFYQDQSSSPTWKLNILP